MSVPLLPLVKGHSASISGSVLAWIGAITANLDQVEAWLKVISLAGAIIASAFTIWSIIRRDRREAREKESRDTSLNG